MLQFTGDHTICRSASHKPSPSEKECEHKTRGRLQSFPHGRRTQIHRIVSPWSGHFHLPQWFPSCELPRETVRRHLDPQCPVPNIHLREVQGHTWKVPIKSRKEASRVSLPHSSTARLLISLTSFATSTFSQRIRSRKAKHCYCTHSMRSNAEIVVWFISHENVLISSH